MTFPEPGWYNKNGEARYWDGSKWGERSDFSNPDTTQIPAQQYYSQQNVDMHSFVRKGEMKWDYFSNGEKAKIAVGVWLRIILYSAVLAVFLGIFLGFLTELPQN